MTCSLVKVPLAVFGLGQWEIIIILGVFLLLFGGKKLPELARGLGRGLRNFREELKGVKDEVSKSIDLEDEESEQPRPTRESEEDRKEDA